MFPVSGLVQFVHCAANSMCELVPWISQSCGRNCGKVRDGGRGRGRGTQWTPVETPTSAQLTSAYWRLVSPPPSNPCSPAAAAESIGRKRFQSRISRAFSMRSIKIGGCIHSLDDSPISLHCSWNRTSFGYTYSVIKVQSRSLSAANSSAGIGSNDAMASKADGWATGAGGLTRDTRGAARAGRPVLLWGLCETMP